MLEQSHINPLIEWLNGLHQIKQLTHGIALKPEQLQLSAGDASARKYYFIQGLAKDFIAVYSPPELEKNDSFVMVAHLLEQYSIPAARLLAMDAEHGFMLQTNAGNHQLLTLLQQAQKQSASSASDVWGLYQQAIGLCVKFQTMSNTHLPQWQAQQVTDEMNLSLEWFWHKVLNQTSAISTLASQFEIIGKNVISHKQVPTHFDFHSRNLLLDNSGLNMQTVDYQDAIIASIGLDPCSLFMDCYVYFGAEFWQKCLSYYFEVAKDAGLLAGLSVEQFDEQLRYVAIQRHTRILGTWSKLRLLFNKTHFEVDVPQVLHYLMMNCNRLKPLHSMANIYADALAQWCEIKGDPEPRLVIDTQANSFVPQLMKLTELPSW